RADLASGAPPPAVVSAAARAVGVRRRQRSPLPVVALPGVEPPSGVVARRIPRPIYLHRVRPLHRTTHRVVLSRLRLVTAGASRIIARNAHRAPHPVEDRVRV